MKNDKSLTIKKFFLRYSIICLLFFIVIILCFVDTSLVSFRNIRNIFSDATPVFLFSMGMALCLFLGNVNLSAGSTASLAGIIAGSLVQRLDTAGRIFPVLPVFPAYIVIPLIVALFYVLGVLCSIFQNKTKITLWFLSLAIASIFTGISFLYISNPETYVTQITGFSNQFLQFGIGYIGANQTYSIPVTLITSIIVIAGTCFFLRYKNIEIITKDVKNQITPEKQQTLFACSMALFALAGMMLTARNGVASPTFGIDNTLDAITICLIAGFSLTGKHGSLWAVFIASIAYIALIYCITFIGLNQYVAYIIKGILLIWAVILEKRIYEKEEKALHE